MITGMPRIAIATNDFSGIVSTLRDKFGLPVIDLSDTSVQSLGAKLAMCIPSGGSNIELMSPADPDAPLSQSLQRFLDRRGQGLFALMLEAPDPNAKADELLGRGLNLLPLMEGAGGRDVHPNSTHGVLIRVYPVNSFQGQAPVADDNTNLQNLSGIMRVIIAINDIDTAVNVYGKKFAMAVDPVAVDAHRGVRFAHCHPPTGGIIELVAAENMEQPFARSIAEFLASRGEGMYALVLESPDPTATARSLRSRGLLVNTSADSVDVVEIDRSSMFGALIRIERGH